MQICFYLLFQKQFLSYSDWIWKPSAKSGLFLEKGKRSNCKYIMSWQGILRISVFPREEDIRILGNHPFCHANRTHIWEVFNICGIHDQKIDVFQYATLDILKFSLIVRTKRHKQTKWISFKKNHLLLKRTGFEISGITKMQEEQVLSKTISWY